ncbi:BLUF domain-containing protein [Autumnicola musiva]|uniref:BLUF domain-containing protein n=1 Tax=Autumnicola musiva TaxID=3075589 RepID=A0ABU3D8K2_9FLAO|nr:BLUF domain-containing protein [Zunongwangia sp. F117]MDT0677850.1 BLUF domain-containing protein [Zunongwangia sp. F117]
MRYAICYVSTARSELPTTEIEHILQITEKNNNAQNLTGLLLYSDGNFFQVLEGEKEEVYSLYNKIKTDRNHHSVIQIFGKCIDKEYFDGYRSKFISSEAQYQPEAIEQYLQHVKMLDQSAQNVVRNILSAFITRT